MEKQVTPAVARCRAMFNGPREERFAEWPSGAWAFVHDTRAMSHNVDMFGLDFKVHDVVGYDEAGAPLSAGDLATGGAQ